MIVNLASMNGHSLVLINYDANRKRILEAFDKILFGQNISEHSSCLEINPSPNQHQVMILRLVNNLGLENFEAAMRYIEKGMSSTSPRFTLPEHLIKKIYNELETEIDAVNRLLPQDEQLAKTPTNIADHEVDFPFNQNDIEYLKESIAITDYEKSLQGRITAPFRYIIPRIKKQIHFLITR